MTDSKATDGEDASRQLYENAKEFIKDDWQAKELINLLNENAELKAKILRLEAQLRTANAYNAAQASEQEAVKRLTGQNKELKTRLEYAEGLVKKFEDFAATEFGMRIDDDDRW